VPITSLMYRYICIYTYIYIYIYIYIYVCVCCPTCVCDHTSLVLHWAVLETNRVSVHHVYSCSSTQSSQVWFQMSNYRVTLHLCCECPQTLTRHGRLDSSHRPDLRNEFCVWLTTHPQISKAKQLTDIGHVSLDHLFTDLGSSADNHHRV
jgi:hypothetical protein